MIHLKAFLLRATLISPKGKSLQMDHCISCFALWARKAPPPFQSDPFEGFPSSGNSNLSKRQKPSNGSLYIVFCTLGAERTPPSSKVSHLKGSSLQATLTCPKGKNLQMDYCISCFALLERNAPPSSKVSHLKVSPLRATLTCPKGKNLQMDHYISSFNPRTSSTNQ